MPHDGVGANVYLLPQQRRSVTERFLRGLRVRVQVYQGPVVGGLDFNDRGRNWICCHSSATTSRRLTERRGWGAPSLQNEASLGPIEYCSRTSANSSGETTARSGHTKLYMHAPTAAVLKSGEKQEFAGIET